MEKKNSLLIVDDDTSNLMELTHILQPEYQIYTSKDGASALNRVKKSLPDLILMDIIMPGMSGFEVLTKLKKAEETRDIPVIFITGISDDDQERSGLAIGAVDYIRKPFDDMVVKLRVRHQIQIVNLRRDLELAVKVAETASQTKSSFLANMSHEIRTPMNAILGITEILIQYETLPAEIVEGLGRIYNSCNLLLGIINDILDFSKIEAGKQDIMPAKYKVASLINDSVHLNMMRINSKPIEFVLKINENVPAKLVGDEIRIKQILNNLLSNAFKYTEAGKVTLTVETKPVESSEFQVMLVLSVEDTGHGMTNEQLGKMFEEYSRFNTEKKTVEGTGLGLAITKRLLNLMGGEMHVESEQDKGSLFVVKLLQGLVDSEVLGSEIVSNLQKFRMNYMSLKKWGNFIRDPMPYGSVLIVDDVETNLYVAVGLMKLYRLNIDTATRGQEAIEKIKSGKKYDVIFMDHMMPEMDGIEAAKLLRNSGYTSSIVALTANAVAGQADMFLQNGFDEFISKPIDIRQLDYILNKHVRDKQPLEVIEAARRHKAEFNTEPNGGNPFLLHADSMLLKSFIRDANKVITWMEEQGSFEFLRNTHPDNQENNNEVLRRFTTIIHGIKSSLWNVNEPELADFALKLEKNGRDGNVDCIITSIPDFLTKLRALLEKLESIQEDENGSFHENTEDLRKKLLTIREMCSDYDRKGVLDTLAEIKDVSKEATTVLDSIMVCVLHSEFEEAESAAAEFLTNCR